MLRGIMWYELYEHSLQLYLQSVVLLCCCRNLVWRAVIPGQQQPNQHHHTLENRA